MSSEVRASDSPLRGKIDGSLGPVKVMSISEAVEEHALYEG